jgi:uncharacterized MAPEG superfamily protein
MTMPPVNKDDLDELKQIMEELREYIRKMPSMTDAQQMASQIGRFVELTMLGAGFSIITVGGHSYNTLERPDIAAALLYIRSRYALKPDYRFERATVRSTTWRIIELERGTWN